MVVIREELGEIRTPMVNIWCVTTIFVGKIAGSCTNVRMVGGGIRPVSLTAELEKIAQRINVG